jgi:glucokinase
MKLQEVSYKEFIAKVQGLGPKPVGIVVDVGATNTRVGVVTSYEPNTVVPFFKFKVNSIKALIDAMNKLAAATPSHLRVASAAINVPGPAADGVGGPIANYEGSTPEEKVLRVDALNKKLFPQGKTRLMNDLEAAAYGVLGAKELEMFPTLFQVMWKGNLEGVSTTNLKGHVIIVAPGTGLGIALLHYHPETKSHSVLPLEFGHTNMVADTLSRAFLDEYARDLSAKEKRGDNLPEYDDVVSGRGLSRIYRHLTNQNQSAEQIAKAAQGGDSAALAALREYAKYAMNFSSQLTMGFVAPFVFLIGDNTVNNSFFYSHPDEVKQMKTTFLSHSTERYGFMSRATVVRQSAHFNLNLLGCVYICGHASEAQGTGILKKSKL